MAFLTKLKCSVGLHDKGSNGSMRRTCRQCKAVWYIDYFGSREAGRILDYKVIDNDGVWLPEMKSWTLHEYDQPPAALDTGVLTIEV